MNQPNNITSLFEWCIVQKLEFGQFFKLLKVAQSRTKFNLEGNFFRSIDWSINNQNQR